MPIMMTRAPFPAGRGIPENALESKLSYIEKFESNLKYLQCPHSSLFLTSLCESMIVQHQRSQLQTSGSDDR